MKTALAAPALGLPAALLAHALVFGADHAVAGALQSTALAVSAFAFICIAGLHAAGSAQGTLAAARIRGVLPSAATTLVSSAAWFGLIEWCEAPHAIPALAVAVALAVACVVVIACMRAFAGVVGRCAIALFAARPTTVPVLCVAAPRTVIPIATSFSYAFRRFSRPPPAFS